MADRPIIFSAPMIRALLAGRKTQTRRLLKPPRGVDPNHWMPNAPGRLGAGISGDRVTVLHWPNDGAEHAVGRLPCAKGDRLYVRERAHIDGPTANYAADMPAGMDLAGLGYRPSIHMPRWASRLTLFVANVWVEPLNDISDADAEAEGVEHESADPPFYYVPGIYPQSLTAVGVEEPGGRHAARSFAKLWEHIHGAGTWASNPWVVAIAFSVQRANIDALAPAAAAAA